VLYYLQDGRSALSMALYNGHEDLAHLLLAKGADIKITRNVSNVHYVNTLRCVVCLIACSYRIVKQSQYFEYAMES